MPSNRRGATKRPPYPITEDERAESRARFGLAVRTARTDTGWSQELLAQKIGVSQSAVGSWENGMFSPDPSTVFGLEALLGLRPGVLSQHLGYIPLGAEGLTTPRDVREAVLRDERLDQTGKTAVIQLYDTLSRG